MSTRRFSLSYPIFCLIAVLTAASARADPFLQNLPHSRIYGPGLIVEHAGTAGYEIVVRNPNRFDPIVLDFALVTTVPVFGDPTDVIANPTVVAFPAIIAAGGYGVFAYTVTTGENPPEPDSDFGITNFAFSTEYSVINGAPNTPTTYLGPTGGTLIIQGQTSNVFDPVTLNALVSCLASATTPPCRNPPLDFLYPPSLNNGNPAYGAFAFKHVTVEDAPGIVPGIVPPNFPPNFPGIPPGMIPFLVPEPSSWALMLVGGFVVGAGLRRRRSIQSCRLSATA